MIPIRDDSRIYRRPVITYALIIICGAVFLWQLLNGAHGLLMGAYRMGMIPAAVLGQELPFLIAGSLPPGFTLLSYMFVHGGWLHILSNMLYLWIFAKAVEDRLKRPGFILLYLASGLAAAFVQIIPDYQSSVPMIGASGAVSGILGAYLVMFPHARVLIFVPISIMFIHYIRARILLIIWFVLQIFWALININEEGGVAWWAHIGGFLFGAGTILIGKNVFGLRRLRAQPWD
ncbi:MAG: rhomboid family intramembrane serine protease [Pseudomonadota bacterium]